MDANYHLDFERIVGLSKLSNEDWFKLIQTKYRRLLSGQSSVQEEEISNEEFEMLQGFMLEQFCLNIQSLVENATIGQAELVQQSEQKLISLLLLNDAMSHISLVNMREYKGFINQENEAFIKQLLNIIFYTDNAFLLEKTFQLICSFCSENNSKTILKQLKVAFKQMIGSSEIAITDIEANLFTQSFYASSSPFNHLKQFFSGQSNQGQSSNDDNSNIIYIIHRKKIILNINIDQVCGKKPFQNTQIASSDLLSMAQNMHNSFNSQSDERLSFNQSAQQLYSQQSNSFKSQNQPQTKEKQTHQQLQSSFYVAKQIIGKEAELQDIFRIGFIIKLIRAKNCTRSLMMYLLSYFTVFSERRELCMNIELVSLLKKDLNFYVPCLLFSLLDDAGNIKRDIKSLFQSFISSLDFQQSLSSNEMKRFIVNTIETDRNCFKYIEHDLNVNILPPYIRNLYSYQRTHKHLVQCESEIQVSNKYHEYLLAAIQLPDEIHDVKINQNRYSNSLYQRHIECIDAIQSYFSTSDLSKLFQANILLPRYFYEEKQKEEQRKKRREPRNIHSEDTNNHQRIPLPSTFEMLINHSFDQQPGIVKFYVCLFLSEVAPSYYLKIYNIHIKKQADNNEPSQSSSFGDDGQRERDQKQFGIENQNGDSLQNQQQIHSHENHERSQKITRGEIQDIQQEYQSEINLLQECHPIFGINKLVQLSLLHNLAKKALINNGNSFLLFRLTNNLQINPRLQYLQILNQEIVLEKIISHESKQIRQRGLPIIEKIITNHSTIYEEMKKRITKLQVWEVKMFQSLASFNNDLLETSEEKLTKYLENEIALFLKQQENKCLFPILLLSCKIFQKNALNDIKDDVLVKERIFYSHLDDYPEFCKIYYLLNVKFKGQLRTIWNHYSSKYPEVLIKEICTINYIRSVNETTILEQKEMNYSQKRYLLFLKKHLQLFQQIPKDLDLRLSIQHHNLHNTSEFKYLQEFYNSTCLFYQIMSQSEFNQTQKSTLLISFFNSLNKIKDLCSFTQLLLNKKLYDNVSKIIQSQTPINQDLLITILNIMDNTVHQSICEFKINMLILIDFSGVIQRQKETVFLFQYLDLVFYDALLAVEKDRKSKFSFDETDYEVISEHWMKRVIDTPQLQEHSQTFKKNRISLIHHKFQFLEKKFNFKIFNFKDSDHTTSLIKFIEKFKFNDFYPEFKNKFDALMYYGILVKNLITYSPLSDFQIIKNSIQLIINEIDQTSIDNLIQLSHIWKNVTNLLCQKLPFEFKNLETLIDLEKQIQKKLRNDQKQIMSFNDQITFFLDNIKDISFSEVANSDFLRVNCELKIKKLFYLESEQKIQKTIELKAILNFLDFSYGKQVAQVILKPFTSSQVLVELSQPQEFHKIQTVTSKQDCKKSLQECNQITTKLMEWMDYFQEFSKTSDSAKKTIISLFEVLKIICGEYPLAVQHIVSSNFHVKLLDITHSLQNCASQKKKLLIGIHTNFSPFLLSQDYAFYEISKGIYTSSSLCLKNHLIQYLIQEGKLDLTGQPFDNLQNKCSYIQNQIIQLLVDIPKNIAQPIALQILSICETLFQKFPSHFALLTPLINLTHTTLNFLIQSFCPDSLIIPNNLLKLSQSFKDRDEIMKTREKLKANKIELQMNYPQLQSLPFLEQESFSKQMFEECSPSYNYNDDFDEKNEESKIEDMDIQLSDEQVSGNRFNLSQAQLHMETVEEEHHSHHQNNEQDSKLNFNFNYDLKNAFKQINTSNQHILNSEKSRNEKCISEILLKFPVFNSMFFENIFEHSHGTNIQALFQLIISLMNHPWNCMEMLNVVFRQSFSKNQSNFWKQHILYNQLVEIALKTSLIHFPLSKGIFCKKTNQIILGEHNLQVDLTQNIFEMDQIPLIQILLRSPQFSKIQEHVWTIIKNDINAEFPCIYQKVVITQNLIDMIAHNITPEKFPQIIMNLIQSQEQIIDVVKYLTTHLEETHNSNFIYYSLFGLRKTLEKFISDLSFDEDAMLIVNDTLAPLREWIIGRKDFVERQLSNMLKKCTQFIQDQVSKFYPMRPDQLDDIEIDLENVSKNFQVLWKIITNIRKEIKMDIQALAEINLILNYDFLESGQLPIMRQRKQSNEVSLTSITDKKYIQQVNTNIQQYHSEDEFSEDFLISKLASMNEITRKNVSFERKIWEFFEQISETLGPEIIGRDVYIHLLNLLKPSLKKSELMRHMRSIVYGNQFTFAKQTRQINIMRDSIWNSTLEEMKEYSTDEWLRAVFSIKFKSKIGEHIIDEIGIDAGGLKNHWITKIVEQTITNNKELFTYTPDQMSVFPNKDAVSKKYLEEFELIGKFVGKSMMDDWSLMVNFAPFFVKSLLKRDLSIGDFYSYDYKTAQQHQWLLENNIDYLDLGLTFSYTSFTNGAQKVIEIKKDGHNIDVNDSNKKEYIQLYCKAKMQDELAIQISYFQRGLFSIIPEDALEALEPEDFISFYQGVQNIDVSYLKKKMKYEGFKSTDKVIEWFWDILKEWDNPQRRKFLAALTEIPGIPVGGYPVRDVATGNVKQLTVSYLNCNPESLPVWHTCFFRVDIPKYNSKEQMKQKLEQSINLSCGFHIA